MIHGTMIEVVLSAHNRCIKEDAVAHHMLILDHQVTPFCRRFSIRFLLPSEKKSPATTALMQDRVGIFCWTTLTQENSV